MELKESTLQVLKNFSTINLNLIVEPGNVVKTITEAKNVLAEATLEESFPVGFGIYDLNEFLSVVSLVDNPTLKFDENYVIISDSSGRSKSKYFYR